MPRPAYRLRFPREPKTSGFFRFLGSLAIIVLLGGGCKKGAPAETQRGAPGREKPQKAVASEKIYGGADWTAVRTYDLGVSSDDLRRVELGGLGNQTVPVIFRAAGDEYPGATLRIRGSWARSWPKKALKISFDKETRLAGHHAVNLNSGWRDPAFVREPLAYYVFSRCGVPAPESRVVRLTANRQFHGLYVEVEQAEKPLLKRYDLKGAILYKARAGAADERDLGPLPAFAQQYERASDKDAGLGELQQFCRELKEARDAEDFFRRRVDIDRYVNYLAACALVQHWDGYNKNHYLVYDAEGSKKWFVIPWDLDRTFGDWWDMTFSRHDAPLFLGTRMQPGVTGWNRLEDQFFGVPEFKARFLKRVSELLDQEFTPEKLNPILDRFEAAIDQDLAKDRLLWPSPAGDLHAGIEGVKRFIVARRSFLRLEIAQAQ